MANETVTAPRGFLAAGIHCGIKQSGDPDIALMVCPTGAKAAGVFTTNKVSSAAVQVCKSHLSSREVQAVVVNSGNANACTGPKGINNAVKMCAATAELIDSEPKNVLVASTGIIGQQLPMRKVLAGIAKAASRLSASASAGLDFARAIMTTDTRPKQGARRLEVSGREVTIAGAIKGAGMIGPNMATTLSFITTDAAISKPLLAAALRAAVGESLNKVTVDGHQSTNDTCLILASGLAGNRRIVGRGPRYKRFTKVLAELCDDLARQMMHDAEGARRIFKVVVKGAASRSEAARAARAVADYPLVKCAVHGADPNWGRIICAVGSAGVKLNPERLSCMLDDVTVFKNGVPSRFNASKARRIVSQAEHTITVDLGAGRASDFCYGCELSAAYVRINADYHT